MELVYLWVEEYKNIKKQGFNFSPRFRCEYDEDTKELIVIDKEETKEPYLKNFFGNKINIIGIVGENGSGKSRLLESFTELNLEFSFFNELSENVSLDYINNEIILWNENRNSYLFKNKYNINEQIRKQFRFNNEYSDQEITIINNLTISFLSQVKEIDSNIYFSPTHIKFKMSKEIKLKSINTLLGLQITYENSYHETRDIEVIDESKIIAIQESFEEKINQTIINQNINEYLLLKEFIYRINNKDKIIFKYLNATHQYGDKDNIVTVFEYIFNNFLDEHKDENFDTIVRVLDNSIKDDFDYDGIILNYRDNNYKEIEKVLVNINRGYFNVEFFIKEGDKELYFNDLSDGEQQLLLMFSKIYYSLRSIYKNTSKDLLLLIDEPDTFLHPNWQKKFISYLIKYINSTDFLKDKKFNILVTSHSPFILSDIPKENVIFLEKGKQVYPFEDNQQTFGANIHALLSHGFFMKDGLMGEFAKDKIQSIIKYHEEILKLELTKKENKIQRNTEKEKYEKEHKTMFWQIKSIIGDDYLKQVIKNHLIEIEKIVLGNDEAKKEEVKRLKAQIELLEK